MVTYRTCSMVYLILSLVFVNAYKKLRSGNMNNQTVQYTPLLRATASDDDEDDIADFDGDDPKANRAPSNQHKALQFKGLTSSKPDAPRNHRRRHRNRIVLVLVVCLLMIGAVAAAIVGFLSHEFNAGVVHDVHFTSHGDWALFFNQSASDSGVTLVDVDGDGLDDVLVGVTKVKIAENLPTFPGLTVKESCIKMGFEYPCFTQVVALRGCDGRELWRTWMRYDMIFVNCDGIDINGDKKPDCIFSGRSAALQAVDLATGKILWVIDPEDKLWSSHFVAEWLVCRALILPDVDGDGISDILLTHGGDPDKEPEDRDRASGRVIFVSGRTGHPLGRYLELPNNRETYMSPVRYQTANGTTYILLGSGGETVSGDLMIISYPDLYGFIMENKPPLLRTLYSGTQKGVMISPVLIDITQDGTLDILMSAFEGVVALYDGETLRELWSRHLSSPMSPDWESYSVPAPGRFDDDDVPDFMMMWGHGRWPQYDYAIVYILSGADGNILWQQRSQMVPYYSTLTLRTKGPHDIFIMSTVGLAQPASKGHSTSSALGVQHKRHIGAHRNTSDDEQRHYNSLESFQDMCKDAQQLYTKEHKTCSMNLSQFKGEVMVMDQAHRRSPGSVHTAFPRPFHYTLPVEKHDQHCHKLSPISDQLVDVCIVLETKDITGGVGDVDGDGEADFIHVESVQAEVITDDYMHDHMYSDLILSRISLTSALKEMAELVCMKDQPWRQFMGSAGDNVYRVPKGMND